MDFILFIIGLITFFKKKIDWAVFIGIVLSTNIFSLAPVMFFPFQHDMKDVGAFLFIIFIVLYKKIYLQTIYKSNINKYILCFGIFVVITMLYDYAFNIRAISHIILTSRTFIFIFLGLFIVVLSNNQIKSVIKKIIILNFILLILSYLQYKGFVSILRFDMEKFKSAGQDFFGFYPPSSLSFSAILLLSLDLFNSKFRTSMLITCIIGIFLTVIRSYIIALGIAFIFIFYSKGLSNIKSLAILLLFGLFSYGIFSSVDQLSNRFNDIDETTKKKGSLAVRSRVTENSIDELGTSPVKSLIGVGWKYVDSRNLSSFNNKVDEALSTPDVAWPVLFLRLGYIGTLILILIYLKIAITAYKNKNNMMSIALLAFLIVLFITSFTSSVIVNSSNFLLIYLLFFYVEKLSNINIQNDEAENFSNNFTI